MDFIDLIDEKKIAARAAQREAEFNTPEKINERMLREQKRQALLAARERGRASLGIIREETGPHYEVSFFDAAGRRFSIDDLEAAGNSTTLA